MDGGKVERGDEQGGGYVFPSRGEKRQDDAQSAYPAHLTKLLDSHRITTRQHLRDDRLLARVTRAGGRSWRHLLLRRNSTEQTLRCRHRRTASLCFNLRGLVLQPLAQHALPSDLVGCVVRTLLRLTEIAEHFFKCHRDQRRRRMRLVERRRYRRA